MRIQMNANSVDWYLLDQFCQNGQAILNLESLKNLLQSKWENFRDNRQQLKLFNASDLFKPPLDQKILSGLELFSDAPRLLLNIILQNIIYRPRPESHSDRNDLALAEGALAILEKGNHSGTFFFNLELGLKQRKIIITL